MAKKKLAELMFGKEEIKKLKTEAIFPEEPERMSEEIRERALHAIKEYNKYGKMIYREGNLHEIAKTFIEIAKFAERFTTESANDWFDGVTVQRNMKELGKLSSDFGAIAKNVQSNQERMTGLYEDMGHILNRYFEIEDMAEEAPPVEDDGLMRQGDRVNVDMNTVRKSNPTPQHVRKVRDEVARGNGTVMIQEYDGDMAIVSGGEISLTEVTIPKTALRKIKVVEAAKFDKEKMKKFIAKDKFLKNQAKSSSAEVLFNTYVLGDSVQEREYNKVK